VPRSPTTIPSHPKEIAGGAGERPPHISYASRRRAKVRLRAWIDPRNSKEPNQLARRSVNRHRRFNRHAEIGQVRILVGVIDADGDRLPHPDCVNWVSLKFAMT
jgi:hypothetical protein